MAKCGEIDIRTAFAYSINTVAAKLLGQRWKTSAPSPTWRGALASLPRSTHTLDGARLLDVRLADMTRAFRVCMARKGITVALMA